MNNKGIILFNGHNKLYYNLDDVAAIVWNMIQQPRTLTEICAEVRRIFHVEHDFCEHDVRALLEQMEREGLIEAAREEKAS